MNLLEIWTEELPSGWEWSADSYVGGTPEFIVNTAECSVKDCDVIVYYDGKPMELNGVFYTARRTPLGTDVVLSINSKSPVRGEHNIYWTNWFHQRQSNCLEFDERIVLSPYHQDIFGDNSRIVPHSCWPEQFSNPVKQPGLCLYSSSPDRGGDFLTSIWKEVHRETGAELVKTYSKSYSDKDMIELYKKAQFWLHPCQGVELFCIAAVKAQVAQCIPVVVPNMALATTVRYGIKTTIDNYLNDIIQAIKNPPRVETVDFGTWDIVTKKLFKNVV